jgi:glycosyltransferase involved in cell wall biosynthesis
MAKVLGLYNDITFHVTSEYELKDTKNIISNSKIQIANDLPENVSMNYNNNLIKNPGELRIIFFSRIVPIKNLKFLLDILTEIKVGTIKLDIYGPIEDLKYWEECTQIIHKLPTNVVVNYMGPLGHDEKYNTIQKSHLFILPSLSEGYGHAIVEAWLSGRPVIISDNTPWRNISDFGLGWDISLRNKDEYIDKISELIKKDDIEYKEMVKSIPANTKKILKLDDEIQNNLRLFK